MKLLPLIRVPTYTFEKSGNIFVDFYMAKRAIFKLYEGQITALFQISIMGVGWGGEHAVTFHFLHFDIF